MNKAALTKRMIAIGAGWHEGNDQKYLIPDGLDHWAYRVAYNGGIRYFYHLAEIETWLNKEEKQQCKAV